MNPAGRVRCNMTPIANGYSGASQPFLFARVTGAKHDFRPRTLGFGGLDIGREYDESSYYACSEHDDTAVFGSSQSRFSTNR